MVKSGQKWSEWGLSNRRFVFGQSDGRPFRVRPVIRPGIYRCTLSTGPCTLGDGNSPNLLRLVTIPPGQPSRPRASRPPTLFFPVGLSASHAHFSGCPGGYSPFYFVAGPTYRYTTPNVLLPQALGYPPCTPRPSYSRPGPSRPSPHMECLSLGPQPGRVAPSERPRADKARPYDRYPCPLHAAFQNPYLL